MDHETLRGIGQRLKEEARRCGLSQSDIGRLLGVTRAAVNHWMGGKNAPEVAQLVRLGHETSISLGYVLIGAPQDKPEILDLASRLAAVPGEQRAILANIFTPPPTAQVGATASRPKHP